MSIKAIVFEGWGIQIKNLAAVIIKLLHATDLDTVAALILAH